MTHYEGQERRKQQDMDHDLLIKIDANLEHFLKEFKEHVSCNKENFGEHHKRLSSIEKSWWKVCGALSAVIVLLDVMAKFVLK